MKTIDLATTAVANVFRSKTRSILTILAIFVGAFTLTLTNGLGTGINAYIDDTVTSIGATDVLTVTKASDSASGLGAVDAGPTEYDPDAVAAAGPPGTTVTALSDDDITTLSGVEGVLSVEPSRTISPDFIQGASDTKYTTSVGSLVAGQTVQLTAGELPDDDATALQLVLPDTYVEPLGYAAAADAIGQTVTIQITDARYEAHSFEARIVGTSEAGLVSTIGSGIIPNDALSDALYDAQSIGLPADQADRYTQASAWFDPEATDDEIAALKDRLSDAGYTGTTVADQLGTLTAVIDGIVLVLNAFAIIALLAAGFGIVNTLYMSVQERTREIGLMKAMGMGNARVFGLFSLEAAIIGLFGSGLGVGIAILAGGALSSGLSTSVLSDLTGLTLISFDAAGVVGIILLVVAIAFLAGTLPAARAARADPVESLRYE